MWTPTILLLASILLPLITAQAVPDGLIVPFTSQLPACASKCGKLFDVQGACTPPVLAETSSICFCADNRLDPISNDGTAGVTQVCTAASCTDPADLQKIKTWYQSYCNEKVTTPTTTSSAGATPTGTSSGGSAGTTKPSAPEHQTWMDTHWKWVVFLVVVTIGIIAIWVGAYFLRRRYLRKKEREIEMRPPVAWGPHQMQNQTGGYGDGVADASGGRSKEAKIMSGAVAPAYDKRESKGWLRKSRS